MNFTTENQLRAEIARVWSLLNAERSGNKWQPIETAPKDGTMILIGCSDADEMVATSTAGRLIDGEEDGIDYMGSDGGFCDVDFSRFHPARSFGAEKSRYEGLQPTHWMPLPAPPAGA